MRSRIEDQPEWIPCAFSRVRTRCAGWQASAATGRWEPIRLSSRWKTGRSPSSDFRDLKVASISDSLQYARRIASASGGRCVAAMRAGPLRVHRRPPREHRAVRRGGEAWPPRRPGGGQQGEGRDEKGAESSIATMFRAFRRWISRTRSPDIGKAAAPRGGWSRFDSKSRSASRIQAINPRSAEWRERLPTKKEMPVISPAKIPSPGIDALTA